MRWSYTYLDVEGKVLQLLESGLEYGIELLKLNLDYLSDSWLNLAMDRVINYSPRDGILEFQLWLPSAYPQFQGKEYASIDWSDMYKRAVIVLSSCESSKVRRKYGSSSSRLSSAGVSVTPGTKPRSARATPLIVPPVPAPATKAAGPAP